MKIFKMINYANKSMFYALYQNMNIILKNEFEIKKNNFFEINYKKYFLV